MNSNLDEPGRELEYVKFTMIENPRRVFFYKKKDNEGDLIEDSPLIACYEQEAGMFGKFHKLVGVGDGKAYYNCLKTAIIKEICPDCGGAKVLDRAVNTETGVRMEKEACARCNGLGSYEKTLKQGMVISTNDAKRVLQEAFEAEWEAAKGKKAKPVYQHVSFDSTILGHRNAKNIMNDFNPPASDIE